MVEVITLLTAVVSAAAAAVSAWVAVAQWRESRAARAGRGSVRDDAVVGGDHRDDGAREQQTGGAGEPGGPEQPVPADSGGPAGSAGGSAGSRPPTDWVRPRSLDADDAREQAPATSAPSRTLAVAAGVAAVCLALTAAALAGYALERPDGAAADGPAGTVLSIAMLLSVCGASLAAWVIVTHRSRTARDQRRTALAFAGSLAPWIALTVVDLVRGVAG